MNEYGRSIGSDILANREILEELVVEPSLIEVHGFVNQKRTSDSLRKRMLLSGRRFYMSKK